MLFLLCILEMGHYICVFRLAHLRILHIRWKLFTCLITIYVYTLICRTVHILSTHIILLTTLHPTLYYNPHSPKEPHRGPAGAAEGYQWVEEIPEKACFLCLSEGCHHSPNSPRGLGQAPPWCLCISQWVCWQLLSPWCVVGDLG